LLGKIDVSGVKISLNYSGKLKKCLYQIEMGLKLFMILLIILSAKRYVAIGFLCYE